MTLPDLLDYPALDGRTVTEAHTRLCEIVGHAIHYVDNVNSGVCPRCGEVIPTKCKIVWWVYTGRNEPGTNRPERIRRTATMRGQWPGYDVECTVHGWESRTGGGVRSWLEQEVWSHKWDTGTLTPKQRGL